MNYNHSAVKLGDKEWLNSEQPGNSEPCLVTNLRVFYIINNLALVNNFSMIKGSVSPSLTVFVNYTQKEANKETDCNKNCLNKQKKHFFCSSAQRIFLLRFLSKNSARLL